MGGAYSGEQQLKPVIARVRCAPIKLRRDKLNKTPKKRLKRLILLVELKYDADIMHGDSQDDMSWFYGEILQGNHLMLIDSGDLGDEIGTIKVLKIAPPK